MKIRNATLADAQAIAKIHVAAWQAAYRGQIPDAILDTLDVERRVSLWKESLRQPCGMILVAEAETGIIGFCHVVPSRDKDADPKTVAEITSIYIHPKFWRRGTGRELCLHAMREARGRHFAAFSLWALTTNIPAKKFYDRMGFVLDGATKTETLKDFKLEEVRFRF